MEKAIKKLLEWGFKEFPARSEAIKSFGLNYCEHCKRGDAIVDFNEGDWFFFEDISGMSGSDPIECIPSYIRDLKDYGILNRRKPKKA